MTKESNRTERHQMPVVELFLPRMSEHDRIVEFGYVSLGVSLHTFLTTCIRFIYI